MALTYSINAQSVAGSLRRNIVTVTFDSSYASGGEAFTANSLGLGSVHAINVLGGYSGYTVEPDLTNSKLKVFTGGAIKSVSQAAAFAAFTDGGGTTGFLDFTTTIPAGSKVEYWKALTTGAWTGDTTAVMMVGVSGDTDRFSADTAGSVFATGTIGSAPLAADVMDTPTGAITPRITITAGSDFGALATTGASTVTVYYLDPSAINASQTNEVLAGVDLSALAIKVEAIGV